MGVSLTFGRAAVQRTPETRDRDPHKGPGSSQGTGSSQGWMSGTAENEIVPHLSIVLRRRADWRAYGLALVTTAGALLVRLALTSWIGDRPILILFVVPILLSAYAGGLGPGLLATVLVAVATAYFVMPPISNFLLRQPVDTVHWSILILVGVLISILMGALRRSFARDITEAAKAGEINARLASIIAFSDDAIVSKDLQGVITSWNPGAERLFGYSAQEAVGKPMAMLIPPERSDEEPMILARIARGETTDHFETVRTRKDGRPIDVSVTVSPIRDRQGHIIGASKIARDITDRKLGDAKVRAQLARLNLLQQITRAIGERQDIREHLSGGDPKARRASAGRFLMHLPRTMPAGSADRHQRRHAQRGARDGACDDGAVSHRDRSEWAVAVCARAGWFMSPISAKFFPFPQRLAKGGLNSMVAAPLLVESKVFGVLIAARRQAHSFIERRMRISAAVERARRTGSPSGSTLRRAAAGLRRSASDAEGGDATGAAAGPGSDGERHRARYQQCDLPGDSLHRSLLEKEPGLSARAPRLPRDNPARHR